MIKSRMVGGAEYIACIDELRIVYKILFGLFWRSRHCGMEE
jgi:hypothetical protein